MALIKNNEMSVGNLLASIVKFIVLFLVIAFACLTWLSIHDRKIDYAVPSEELVIPKFTKQSIDFVPVYDKSLTLPFTASAIIDIDNDGIEEVFIGGGVNQQDALFRFKNGTFVNVSDESGIVKSTPDDTFSAISLDLDADGDNDLLVTRQSGVWKYSNDQGHFSGQKLALKLDPETVPLSVGVADLNRDGLFDLFVAGYIARKFVQGETIFNQTYGGVSELFLNTGDDTFKSITKDSGLAYKHNTFLGVFLDVDKDKREDLIVAHDTGQVRTWKNQGNLYFELMTNPTSNIFAYPMGIAVTDLGNDGLPDFWFSNVGTTTPDFMVRGDLEENQVLKKEWFMFKNNGDFEFEDIAEDVALANYEFSWGAVFEDFNLDGRDDLVVSENYTGWPLHALKMWRLDGRFLLQTQNGQFSEVTKAVGTSNREFGITPLTADFNQDGYPDLIHINLLGKQQVYLSEGGDQGYLKVVLPNTVESIGANVSITLDNGKTLSQFFVVGEGLVSDQSHKLIFGLNEHSVTNIEVSYLGGKGKQITGTFRNEVITVQ